MNAKVDRYVTKARKWREEIQRLREILLSSPLTEEFKWGKPCYTFQDSNVVIIFPLKECCALLLAKGALLKDPKRILIQPTENTQSARQPRFTSVQGIAGMETTIKAFVKEAIKIEQAGLELTYKRASEFKVPKELRSELEANHPLKAAFAALTPGRQRGYLLYFAAAKQSKTRKARMEKCAPQIRRGKGLNDK